MSTAFDLNQDGIIRNAYQMAGIVAPGDEPDTAQMAFGADILNVRTKALQSEGIILRTVTQVSFPLTAGVAKYALPASTLDVDTGTPYVSNGNGSPTNVPLEWYSRAMYMALTVPSTLGQPTSIYVEKTTTINVYLYPVPDGNWPTMTLPIISLLGDMSLGTDLSGLQAKYLDTLILSVAVRLALSFAPAARYQALKKEYEDAKELATNDDTERGSLRFMADYGQNNYGRRVL